MQPNPPPHLALQGTHIVSLALNLPGPAALMRLCALGARCTKIESPAGDPMGHYNPAAYAQLHSGMRTLSLDLKTDAGQAALRTELAQADVLLTSFRPSALRKLALDWDSVHPAFPHLSMVCIVGSPGARAEEPGHDLTYLAENDLVTGLDMPATLYADMAGSLMTTEAVLQAVLLHTTSGQGVLKEVALSDAAAYLALPRQWGLTRQDASNPTHGVVGGAHAGYRVYACADGRVAVAALEPHFAAALCEAAGIALQGVRTMLLPQTHSALEKFFAAHTCTVLQQLAAQRDIPLHCMA
jgi:alpha-methylacyl-CoA racemase